MRVWLALLVSGALSAKDPSFEKHLLRLAEEAEIFAMLAPKVIGQERLEQVAMEPPPRFRKVDQKIEIPYKRREIVSEYGYTSLKDDPSNMHEIRQVVSVDGKPVKTRAKARETLTMGLRGDNDKLKKRMLKDFEAYGLRDSATDFGQLILLFGKRSQEGLDFKFVRRDYVGPDRVIVLRYEQKEMGSGLTVFEGRRAVQHKLRGELWLAEEDGVPMRITVDANRASQKAGDKELVLKYAAVVDYVPSPHGALLPVSVRYNETLENQLIVENRYRYSDFKIFGASSEIKFTAEDPQPAPPSEPKKP